MRDLNYPEMRDKIAAFIKDRIEGSGVKGAIIGLSGGIDSTLTAYLTVLAIGHENVLGLLLPETGISPDQDIEDALLITKILGIEYRMIEISPVISAFSSVIPAFDADARTAKGNLKARTRMCILYYNANLMNRMVIGTGNKTELLLGYFTKYGDGGVDIEPIGGLYKTDVRGLSRYIGIPERMIKKTPTAGLWPGQTDESELGVSYEMADEILNLLVDEKRDISDIKRKFPSGIVDMIVARIESSAHKRMLPATIDI